MTEVTKSEAARAIVASKAMDLVESLLLDFFTALAKAGPRKTTDYCMNKIKGEDSEEK